MAVKSKPKKKELVEKKWSLGKISAIIGVIATAGTTVGGVIKTYLEVVNSRSEVVQSIALTRELIIDDFTIRRDQAKHYIEFLETKLKLEKPNSPKYLDLRDEIFRKKDIKDDLDRLIEKARKGQ